MRIGIGYDVHSLIKNRPLIIGGIRIPFKKGLIGHSDADVLIHSIIDAILGALVLGDIGHYFPDTDFKYKDINSLKLLLYVRKLINDENYTISNIDSIIIAEKPKMSQYFNLMKKNISSVLNIDINQINIKATTEEGLGYIGKGKGIASKAIVLLKKNRSNNEII